MKKKIIYFTLIVAVVVAVWAILGMQQPASAPTTSVLPPAPTSAAPSAAAPTTTAPAAFTRSEFFDERTNPALGAYLADANGRTLYTYSPDAANKSNCTGQCLLFWPPYGPGISASGTYNLPMLPANVGTITGNNGMAQFTWKGMPLYHYAKDLKAGDVNGQGVGGVWYVVRL